MKKKVISKYISFGTMAVLIVMMVAATVIGKATSNDAAFRFVYHSPVFIALWALAVVSGLVWIWKAGLPKRPLVLCLHLSFVVILAGALVSHIFSSSGMMRLRIGETADSFYKMDGQAVKLPFSVRLDDFEVNRYAGSTAAMDYTSKVTVIGKDGETAHVISMNNILKFSGYRFYQSSYDEDEGGSILSVSHDPWGVTITYIGYLLLLICLVGFFFCKESGFRSALSRIGRGTAAVAALLLACGINMSAQSDPQEETTLSEYVKEGSELTPKVFPKVVADSLCNLYVSYSGRIAPLHTLARDYVMKVYGKPRVNGYSAEQVFTGWMYYFDTWRNVPIKLKAKERATSKEDEKYYAMQSVASQRALRVFPYTYPDSTEMAGQLVWLSPSEHLPAVMDIDEWTFMRKVFTLVGEYVAEGDNEAALGVISKIAKYQRKNASAVLPSASKTRAELTYNRLGRPMAAAMFCVTLGIILFILTGLMITKRRSLPLPARTAVAVLAGLLAVYLTILLGLRWYVSGHVPMAGGFEMMLLIAWMALIFSTAVYRRLPIFQPLGLILAGFALLVAVLGESNPKITPLMPVLSSPLLSVHVATMMISYTLLGIAALNGIMGVAVRDNDIRQNLADTGLVILYPGIFLLVIGIFLGAVWANVSWGSYWMWDPKETWALITALVYAAVFHKNSIPAFRKPLFFHWFCILAFLCVLITYFGVNFFLGGMHSYAA